MAAKKKNQRRYALFAGDKNNDAASAKARPRPHPRPSLAKPPASLSTPPTGTASAVRTTPEKVTELLRAHHKYTFPAMTKSILNQPNFDEMASHGFPADKEDRLRQIEVRRLFSVLEATAGTAPRFGDDDLFGAASKHGYEALANTADMISAALRVCQYDNQLVLAENFARLMSPDKYRQCEGFLLSRFEQGGAMGGASSVDSSSAGGGAAGPAMLTRRYCALLDFITAVLARFAVEGVDDDIWQTRALCGLARVSAKMKLLALDLEKYALQSLENGKDLIGREEARRFFGFPTVGVAHGFVATELGDTSTMMQGNSARAAEYRNLMKSDDRYINTYYAEMCNISDWALSSISDILFGMKISPISGLSANAFDICSLIYRTAFAGNRLLLHQDRDGELTARTLGSAIHYSYTAFQLLDRAISTLLLTSSSAEKTTGTATDTDDQNASSQPSSSSDDGTDTYILFRLSADGAEADQDPRRVSLRRIKDVVTVMVPLLCTMPVTVNALITSLHNVSGFSSVAYGDTASRTTHHTAFASLRTAAYDRESLSTLPDTDFRPLSRSLVAQPHHWLHLARGDRDRRGGGRQGAKGCDTEQWALLPRRSRAQMVHESDAKMRAVDATASQWECEEKAVRVRCPKYVYSVMAICGVLVVGGFLTGMFVGVRIPGVDPFGFTTFTWVLAGFIILVAKSVRVNEWPWRDFLLGRVTCHSVSELHAVTGVESQDILAFLLAKEANTTLITKGPFNRAFARRSDDGFSIDERPELRTLVAAGIVAVKIATLEGPGVMLLDLRRTLASRVTLLHSDGTEENESVLASVEPPQKFDGGRELVTTRVPLSWSRIIGIYHEPDMKFR